VPQQEIKTYIVLEEFNKKEEIRNKKKSVDAETGNE
jgi:hypothetical protein